MPTPTPPATAANPIRNVRRAIFPARLMFCVLSTWRQRSLQLPVCADRCATAQVGGHRAVDILVRRLGIGTQERSGRHDLPRLAVAALRDLMLDPCRLHRVHRLWRPQPLDGGDVAAYIADLQRAGPHRYTTYVYSAGAAHGDSA